MKVRTVGARSIEVRPREHSRRKGCRIKSRAVEVGINERRARSLCSAKISRVELRAIEVGAYEVGVSDVHAM
jgi:hypothetical protein